jgi:hypothetical protein
VEKDDDGGVCGKGEAGGDNEDVVREQDVGEPSTSSVTVHVCERSSTDGLLLGMGDSQVSFRESSGGRTPSSWADRRSNRFRIALTPSSLCVDEEATSSARPDELSRSASSTTRTGCKAVEEDAPFESVDHLIVVVVAPLSVSRMCGGRGRLSALRLRRLRAAREKVSVQLSPWMAARSVAEKQLGQHGRRGIVTRGVCGRVGARAGWVRDGGGSDERRWMEAGGLPSLRLNFLERLEGQRGRRM